MSVADLDNAVSKYKDALTVRDNVRAAKKSADDALASAQEASEAAAASLEEATANAVAAKDALTAQAEELLSE